MKIRNIEGLTASDLQAEAAKGARFVYYPYTISLLLLTLNRTSGVYLIKAGQNPVKKGMGFTLISLFFGWWGIPFGPKYALQSIRTNLKGGKDVTDEVMDTVAGHILFQETRMKRVTV